MQKETLCIFKFCIKILNFFALFATAVSYFEIQSRKKIENF